MKSKAAFTAAFALACAAVLAAAAWAWRASAPSPAGTAPAGWAAGAPVGPGASASAAASAAVSDAAAAASPEEVAPPRPPTYAELVEHLRSKPDDARVLVLKARLDAAAERPAQAAEAYGRALAQARSKVRLDARVWVEYAEALALAQGGSLAGAPQQPLQKALEIDPLQPQALDLAGSAAWALGDYAAAARYWRRLQGELEPGSPRARAVADAIAAAEQRSRFALPPAVSSPAR